MTDPRKIDRDPGDEQFDSLFADVEPRSKPPEDIEQAAFEHFYEQCSRFRADRKRRRNMAYMAIAASVVLALLVQPMLFHLSGTKATLEPAGLVAKIRGDVRISDQKDKFKIEVDADSFALHPGYQLQTGTNSGLSINWSSGLEQVRVDQDTHLKIISASQVELGSGRIYIDMHPGRNDARADDALQVITPFGTVKHLGTQYIVAVENERTDVLVREGVVEIRGNSVKHTVDKGTRASVDTSGGFNLTAIEGHGDEWEWAQQLSPGYEIEGRRLTDFLQWFQRETGRTIQWESPELEFMAESTILHGPKIETDPMQALDVMLMSSGLEWSEQDGQILVSSSP